MFSKNNRQMNQQKQGEKVTRYAIKKFSFGAASVAVACGIYFANGAAVQAESQDNVTTTSLDHEVASETSHQPAVQAASPDQAADATPASSASSDQASAPAASESSAAESSSQKEEPANKEDQAAQASSENSATPAAPAQPAATSPASSAEQPAANTEVTQPSRSRRVRRDATPTGLRDGDPNSTIAKPTLADSEKKRPADLVKQINWLDFGDSQAFRNLDTDGSLKIGSVYEKEISPGYVVKLTVTELKPFHSTEVYRDRVAGTEYANTYDPDAKNTWFRYVPADYNRQVNEGDSARPKIIGAPMNKWTALREQGIDTNGRKTQLQVPKNGASYGVKFKVEATYLNKPVKATVVMADGEEANPGEYAIFTTNGQGWEHLAEWKRVSPSGKEITETYAPMNPNRLGQYIGDNATTPTIDWTKFTNPDQRTGGLGSQVFGPNTSKDHTVPIVMTREASEVGIYIASSGQQGAMIGFMVVDTGDAPESYGNAVHTISGYNAATGAQNPQPFLGRKPADIDTTSGHDWTHDDKTDHADEGIDQLLPDDLVGKTHELFRADRLRDGDYSIRFHASANGNEKAYVRAWIDFNNNGVFDENEASEFTEVTNEGDYTVTFRNHPPMNDDTVKKLGMRVRIALNQGDIEKPTGTAFSGEVEDLQVNLTYPPKGEKKETKGLRDQQQQTSLRFTPRGFSKDDENVRATIDTNKAPVVLDNAGTVLSPDAEGWYTTAEGRYKVTPNGDNVDVVFVPKAGYVGTTSGINIRRFDSNGASTEWTAKNNSEPVVNQPLNSMDARYIPKVLDFTEHLSTDAQGLPQVKDILFTDGNPANTPVQPSASNPATFLDAEGNPVSGTSIPATSGGKEVGTFSLDPATGRVTFTPNKSFVGTVDPVNLQVNDANGNEHRATYQPTVTRVVPTGQNASSEGIQGAEQSGNLVFTPGDSRVPIDEAVAPTFDNGKSTKEVPGVGTYTVDNTGRVTFQPLPGYTGRPNPETVKRVDKNGTEVTATYQADVKAATPTGQDTQTTGLQGQLQTSQLNFTPGQATVNNQTQTVPLNPAGPQFVVDGQVQQGNTLAVSDASGKLQGTYTVKPNGEISFQPAPDFYGTPTPARLRVTDSNGSTADAVYQPNVTQVTPTSTNAESNGVQGQPQKGTPTFKPGDPAVPIDMDRPMTFEDGKTTKSVPGVGDYSINPDGSISFTPDKQYVGTPAPVTVKRVDKNGTPVTATYTPTVTRVTPTSTNAVSTGIQGQPQKGTPTFTEGNPLVPLDDDQPMTFEDGQRTKKVPNVGEYSINPDGSITFTPEKQYVGTPDPVTVRRVDKNGTPVTATYTPTVTKVTPTSTNAESNGIQGKPQKGTPTFTAGDPLVPLDDSKPMTFEDGSSTKKVPNVGTYVIESDGTITFTPDKQYVGTPDPVTVKRVDKNGTEVTATYTPTVTKVTPTSTDDTSEGVQGQPQKGTPTFSPGNPEVPIDLDSPMTFEDGQPTKTVQGVGVYTINPDGSITFTPDKQYVGTPDPVVVKRVDKNGTEVTAKYTPTVTRVTPTSTNAESSGIQGKPQKGTPTFTEGNPLVPMDDSKPMTFEDGSSTKTVPNVGVYTINPDGSITFTPDKQYVGTPAPVTVKRVDKNGTEVTATYTPTVTKVTPTSKDDTSTGVQGQPQTGTPVFTPGDPAVPIDLDSPMTFEDGQPTKTVPGVGEYSINPDGSITFTPDKQYVGTPDPVVVKRVDKNGTEVTAKYTPTVTRVTPTSTNDTSEGLQGQPQKGTPTFTAGDPLVPLDDTKPMTFEDGSSTKTVPNVGVYTINPDGSITFTPDKQYVGTPDPVVVKRVDKNGTEVTATYTPTVTKVTPTSKDDTSTGVQGIPQTGTPVFTPGDPAVPIDLDSPMTFEDGQPKKSVPGVGEYSINPDGSITFMPDKQYVGTPAPVTVKRVDKNGTEVTAKYTPTVTKVTPTSKDDTSTGVQGIPQTGTPVFTAGDPAVPIDLDSPMTFEDGSSTKSVPGVGEYSINPDGSITFTPDKQYVGTPAPVTVKRVDKNGTPVTANYTPTVTRVTPTSQDAASTGAQGLPQSGTPSFTPGDPAVPIDMDSPMTFDDGQTTKSVPGVGEYSINPDGSITFTPEKQYVGTPAAVVVKRVDKNGTPVTAQYTPTVTPVTPTSEDVSSTGLQGQKQTGTPTFTPGNPEVPMDDTVPMTFEDGSSTKSVPGVGEYSINPDGSITFTPDKQFVGKPDPVRVKRVDKNGTPVTADYQVEVTRVTPTSTPATSTGLQGQPQTGSPVFKEGAPEVPMDDTVPMTFEDGSSTKTVPNVGVYTINPDGSITFTPDKQYVGTPDPVTVKRVDKNGTSVTATYTPTVTKVTPTSTPATSTGLQGQPQTGSPSFTPGDPVVPMDDSVPMTFEDGSTTKSVPGVGEYSINPDGSITFTPDKQFVGTPDPVTVKRVDKNGTPVTATYTPTVTKVTPTSTPATSTGAQGLPQSGTPSFTPGDPIVPMDDSVPMTFEDGSSTKSVPGVGDYSINPDGSITFTPDKQFVGTPDPVTVKRVDKNGTPVTATYTPTVTKVTPTSTPATSTGLQGQPQSGSPIFTPGNPEVPMDDTVPMTFEDGSTTKSVPGVGEYSINPDGSITFTPDKQFVGSPDPVTVKRVDKNGTPVTATYTPTVTKVTPTSMPATSTGAQGYKQSGKPVFTPGASVVPMDDSVPMTFEDGTTTKTVIGEGVYTIQADGSIEFVPEKTFTGQGSPLTVKRVDKNGTPVTATYQATVIPVKPGANNDYSSGVVNQAQTGQVKFVPGSANVDGTEQSVDLVPGSLKFVVNGQAVADTTIPALDQAGNQVGTYSLAQDGTVTFTPNPGYVGQPVPARVQATDVNGTTAEATYSPVVNASVTSEGMKGQSQSKLPDFKGQVDPKVPAYLEGGVTSVTVPGQGTYTVNPETGEVTFTPEPDFIGEASPITVIRRDVNGKELKIQYIPTVYGQVKTQDTTSTGYPGEKQTGTPVFEGDVDLTIPATFENGQTELTVPGEGTYVLNPDGSVTFTPEAGFLGQASGVTVVRVDRNGRKVTAQYVPTVVPVPVAPSEPEVQRQGLLPATGEAPDYSFFSGVALTILASVGLVATRKRQATDED